MIVLTWLAWLATAVCLYTYVRMQRGGNPALFDWANAIGCIPLVIMDYLVGATPAAVISLAFGIAGAHGRIAAWRERRTLKRWAEARRLTGVTVRPVVRDKAALTASEAWERGVALHMAAIYEREEARRG